MDRARSHRSNRSPARLFVRRLREAERQEAAGQLSFQQGQPALPGQQIQQGDRRVREPPCKYNPDLKDAYRFLGESYKALYQPGKDTPENKEREAKALEALNKAYEIDPNNKEIIYSLGDMYDRMRDVENAEKMFLRIIELEPGNMNNYYIVAEFYKRYAGEHKELKAKAEDMYLRRIETDPENVQGYAYMADYYDKLPAGEFKDKFDEALKYI